jgi:AraC-like DNA-binding protein
LESRDDRNRWLLRAKDYIDLHYADKLLVADVAQIAHLSSAHFARSFQHAFGETPHEYVMSRRLERAAFLLRHTDYPVWRICSEVGLRSVGSFTTAFRNVFGETPASYRGQRDAFSFLAFVPSCVAESWDRPKMRRIREVAAPPAS